MTPVRFWLAMGLFHVAVILWAWRTFKHWRSAASCQLPTGAWLRALARNVTALTVFAGGAAVVSSVLPNLDILRRLRLGSIAGRLMSQALFGELILLGLALTLCHRAARRAGRAVAFGGATVALFSVYVDAYHVEPRLLRVRHYVVGGDGGPVAGTTIRILHITDIQTPTIGAHEERALRTGLAYRPDLIVMTGDYVQNALGRPTEERAKQDLRALMARLRFEAPLGVFATEGDAGLPCGNVFAGTTVRCLVDESALVPLPGGGALSLTGLSGRRGRVRDPAWLSSLMARAPQGQHRIFISHAPDFVDALPAPVDLVLAGHTHGGQVVIPFFGPPRTASRLPRRYAGGLHDYRGTPLHVSRGVGMERGFAPPVRFFCPPEISVLDVHLRAWSHGSRADNQARRVPIDDTGRGMNEKHQAAREAMRQMFSDDDDILKSVIDALRSNDDDVKAFVAAAFPGKLAPNTERLQSALQTVRESLEKIAALNETLWAATGGNGQE